jgi:hypothetical protein
MTFLRFLAFAGLLLLFVVSLFVGCALLLADWETWKRAFGLDSRRKADDDQPN